MTNKRTTDWKMSDWALDDFAGLAAEIVETTPMLRPMKVRRAALYANNVKAVFSGTEWLTNKDVERQRMSGGCGPRPSCELWHAERRVFGVHRRGRFYYPRYVFSEVWKPIDAVTQVLEVLAGYSEMRIASWFESTNSYLDGRRPRETLVKQPELTVTAARSGVMGIAHG